MSVSIGVVGAGYMGRLHARTVAETPGARLVAVVDVDEQTGRATAGAYGARFLGSVDDALADPGIDAYIVAVPDRTHVEPARRILSAGRPVLLEKPMADTLDGAREIARAARESGARLLVGQILRFDPRYAGAARAVRSGQVGEPLHVTAGRIAVRDVGVRMAGASSVCFYLGVHDVDAMQWITGKRITRVYSRAVRTLMPSLGVDSEDAILSVCELEDGAVGQLFNGWTRPSTSPVTIDGRFELMATEGVVEIDVRDHGLRIVGGSGYTTPDGLHWPEVNDRIRGDLAAEVAHFVRALETGEGFVVGVAEAMRAVAVNDAILRSVRSGAPADVEDVEHVGDG